MYIKMDSELEVPVLTRNHANIRVSTFTSTRPHHQRMGMVLGSLYLGISRTRAVVDFLSESSKSRFCSVEVEIKCSPY